MKNMLIKGNVILIGQENNGNVEVDGRGLYNAYCLSDERPYLIQEERGKLHAQKPIYLCGSADKKQQMIGGLDAKEIARKLSTNFSYCGEQEIIFFCDYGKRKGKEEKDMSDFLFEALQEQGILTAEDRGKVKAYAKNIAIIVEHFGVIQANDICYLDCFFRLHEEHLLRKWNGKRIPIPLSHVQIELEKEFQRIGFSIARYHYNLMERNEMNDMDSRTKTFIMGTGVALLCCAFSFFFFFYKNEAGMLVCMSIVTILIFIVMGGLLVESGYLESMVRALKQSIHHKKERETAEYRQILEMLAEQNKKLEQMDKRWEEHFKQESERDETGVKEKNMTNSMR